MHYPKGLDNRELVLVTYENINRKVITLYGTSFKASKYAECELGSCIDSTQKLKSIQSSFPIVIVHPFDTLEENSVKEGYNYISIGFKVNQS